MFKNFHNSLNSFRLEYQYSVHDISLLHLFSNFQNAIIITPRNIAENCNNALFYALSALYFHNKRAEQLCDGQTHHRLTKRVANKA